MFRPPPTSARIAAPTGVHFNCVPEPQQGIFSLATVSFDADINYYTRGIIYEGGVEFGAVIFAPGSTSGLVANFHASAGAVITAGVVRQPYSSPSGGDSVVTMAPESYVSLPP